MILEFSDMHNDQQKDYTGLRDFISWDGNIINLTSSKQSCSSGEILDKETWQYNIETEEYTLIE